MFRKDVSNTSLKSFHGFVGIYTFDAISKPILSFGTLTKCVLAKIFFPLPQVRQRVHFTVVPPDCAVLFTKLVSPFQTMLLLMK